MDGHGNDCLGRQHPHLSGGRYCAQTTATPTSIVSRKIHGAAGPFDILPLTGSAGVECRTGGVNRDYQIVFTFPSPVTVNGASADPEPGKSGSVAGPPTIGPDGSQVTVNLTGVSDAQTLRVTLSGVNNGTSTTDAVVSMKLLLGDSTGNGTVNSTDVGQIKANVGATLSPSNFRSDVTANGSINSSDVGAVKAASGGGAAAATAAPDRKS